MQVSHMHATSDRLFEIAAAQQGYFTAAQAVACGYRVVRPLRAIADLLHEGTADRSHLRASLRQALDRGLVTRTEFNRHPDCAG
jgi:hypothetical protein